MQCECVYTTFFAVLLQFIFQYAIHQAMSCDQHLVFEFVADDGYLEVGFRPFWNIMHVALIHNLKVLGRKCAG